MPKVTRYFCSVLMMVTVAVAIIHTYSASPRFPESATTVKATSPIFQIDFYFAAKVIKSLQPAPPARRGNQLSLVNETNNDSIILFTQNYL